MLQSLPALGNGQQKNEDSGARTHDLLPVKQALSQLSYVFMENILTENSIRCKQKIRKMRKRFSAADNTGNDLYLFSDFCIMCEKNRKLFAGKAVIKWETKQLKIYLRKTEGSFWNVWKRSRRQFYLRDVRHIKEGTRNIPFLQTAIFTMQQA